MTEELQVKNHLLETPGGFAISEHRIKEGLSVNTQPFQK